MLLKIKNKVECELKHFILSVDKIYGLSRISPILSKNIKDFILREGKRIRPILFVTGYLGFAKKALPGLYRSAISLELLHDFLLVHDDIIDKSNMRRGKPSMHEMFNKYLARYKNTKISGQDLTIVAGDVMFAIGLSAFLCIKEKLERKEAALKKLIDAAMRTGSGEFIELLSGLENVDKITRPQIYKIYDYKTANYTFASPLAIGAILAGADKAQIDLLFKYGMYLGRAFQIRDDIAGIFGEQKRIGKSNLTDLQEAKKTILVWYAYHNSNKKNRAIIKNILSRKNVRRADLIKMRKLIIRAGALDYAKKEIYIFIKRAQKLSESLKMRPRYKNFLSQYSCEILNF